MSILLAQLILLASTASQGFVLPAPTGQHRIGTSHFGFVAGTPSFRVPAAEPVQLWYPAEGGSKVAPYVDSTLLTALVKGGYYEQSTETIQSWSSLVTHSYLDARLKKGKHALLI